MGRDTLKQLRLDCEAAMRAVWAEDAPALVFGDGNENEPRLMLVGEAPGEQEALQGKPFVGKAGKNLTEFLSVVGLKREELYISNVVKFRPSRLSAAGRRVNRPPTREEVALFTPWLMREVAIVRPRALVTLGNVALNAFLPQKAVIGDCHGRWHRVRIELAGDGALMLPLFALYHPASVIYNRSLSEVYKADLQKLTESISDSNGFTDT
jgi:uracil-DNA glycosylase family 4